jgi:hypothetical protein
MCVKYKGGDAGVIAPIIKDEKGHEEEEGK